MNRGSAFKLVAYNGKQTRFNEAPIHESGK